MKQEVARQIVDIMKRVDRVLSEVVDLTAEIEDASERRSFRDAVFHVAMEAYEKITREIADQYPEMHPDNVEGGWTYKPGASSSRGGR
jgi:hypothetical protein